jgi:hypothetical protein
MVGTIPNLILSKGHDITYPNRTMDFLSMVIGTKHTVSAYMMHQLACSPQVFYIADQDVRSVPS